MYKNGRTRVQYVCEDSGKITVCEFHVCPEGIAMHILIWVSRVWVGTVLQEPPEMLISFITPTAPSTSFLYGNKSLGTASSEYFPPAG